MPPSPNAIRRTPSLARPQSRKQSLRQAPSRIDPRLLADGRPVDYRRRGSSSSRRADRVTRSCEERAWRNLAALACADFSTSATILTHERLSAYGGCTRRARRDRTAGILASRRGTEVRRVSCGDTRRAGPRPSTRPLPRPPHFPALTILRSRSHAPRPASDTA